VVDDHIHFVYAVDVRALWGYLETKDGHQPVQECSAAAPAKSVCIDKDV
jgi:hypothetical protein